MTSRELWLELRRSALGGSDIAAICGLSRWRGPLEVYLDKRGLIEPEPDNEAMYWGRSLEEPIAARYAEETGERLASGAWTVRPDEPWAGGTPDRIVCDADGRPIWGLEIKTSGSTEGWGAHGTDEIPDYYRTQVAWYQWVCDLDRWDVAVLFRGREFRRYTVMRDVPLQERLIAIGRKFWHDHVLAGVPPEPTHQSVDTVKRLFPANTDDTLIAATNQHEELVYELRRAKDRLAEEQCIIDGLEARIKAAIGEHAGLEGRGWRATWKNNRPTIMDDWMGIATALAARYGLTDAELAEVARLHKKTRTGARVLRLKLDMEE